MKNSFKGYYRPNKKEFEEIWKSAYFVFDANILLNLYRWPESASKDFWKVLTVLKDRIWLPHQAGVEYQRNRHTVINDQSNKYSEVVNIFNESYSQIEKRINDLSLKKRHSEIDPDAQLKSIKNIIDNYSEVLERKRKDFVNTFQETDDIRNKIDKYFENKVGHPLTNEQLEDIYTKGPDRYANGKPPGFRDSKKSGDDYHINNLRIITKYGDVIVWNQIIEKFKDIPDPVSVIFITDDVKEDWWWIEKSGAKRNLGPRPELIEEITSEANVKYFYMYNSDRFLKYAKEYLDLDVKEESIKYVKEVQEASQFRANIKLTDNQLNAISGAIKSLTIRRDWLPGFKDENEQERAYTNGIIREEQTEHLRDLLQQRVNNEIELQSPRTIKDILRIRQELKESLKFEHSELLDEFGQFIFDAAIDSAVTTGYRTL